MNIKKYFPFPHQEILIAPEHEGKNVRVNNKTVADKSQFEIDWFCREVLRRTFTILYSDKIIDKDSNWPQWVVRVRNKISFSLLHIGERQPHCHNHQWKKY
jgi:hypothetical protein